MAVPGDVLPGLIVFRTCKNLIRSLPSLPYSPTNPEDMDTDADDDCYDALSTRPHEIYRLRVA